MLERLQKFMSGAGVASRRRAEELITAGLVKVNGKVVRELGSKVDPDKDVVLVQGKKIQKQQFIYLALNKPRKTITTRHDPRKRKTVFDLLPAHLKKSVWPIGRLDFETEGLLIFTNDGDLTQQLAHPSREHDKEYEVMLDKEVSEGRLAKIRDGMILDGRKTSPAKVRTSGTTVYITIHEGWNRQIRRMFGSFGYSVRNVKRIRVGKLKLANLKLGEYRIISREEII